MPGPDLLSNLSQNNSGPFSGYLQAPVYQSNAGQTVQQQPGLGYMGAAGKTALILDNFLQGVSRGRFMAFQKSEKQRMDNLALVQNAVQGVASSNLPEQEKNAQFAKLNQMMAQLVLSDHSVQGGSSRGKKGGGQSGGGQTEDQKTLGHHVLEAMRGMAENMLGPSGKKPSFDPDQLKGELFDVYKAIGSPQNSAQAQLQQQGQEINQAAQQAAMRYGKKVFNPQTGQWDTQPANVTETQLLSDPQFTNAMNRVIAANGGQPPPMLQAILRNARSNEEEQRRLSDPQYQAQLEREKAETAAAKAREKFYESPAKKYTGQMRQLIDAYMAQGMSEEDSAAKAGQLVTSMRGLSGQMKTLYQANKARGMSDDEAYRRAGDQVAANQSLTPLQRIALEQGFRRDMYLDTKEGEIDSKADSQMATVDRSKQTEADKQKERQKIEERRQKELDRLHSGTMVPPKSKAKAAAAADSTGSSATASADKVADAIVNAIVGGTSPSTSAPPKGPVPHDPGGLLSQ